MSSATGNDAIYHEMIIDYSRNPLNFGRLDDADVTYHDSNPLCGDSIDMDLKFGEGRVSGVKFHGKGCAICMACSSVITEMARGKTIDEARAIAKDDVLSELGLEHLQAVRIKCALLPLKVLKYALYAHLARGGRGDSDGGAAAGSGDDGDGGAAAGSGDDSDGDGASPPSSADLDRLREEAAALY